MSSVPYVPPETIKKVAATNGHSVSLMDLVLDRGEDPADDHRLVGTVKGSAGPISMAVSWRGFAAEVHSLAE